MYVRHETIRIAVLHTLKTSKENKIPSKLVEVMEKKFLEYYSSYIKSCNEFSKECDGQKISVSWIDFALLYKRLTNSVIVTFSRIRTAKRERKVYWCWITWLDKDFLVVNVGPEGQILWLGEVWRSSPCFDIVS